LVHAPPIIWFAAVGEAHSASARTRPAQRCSSAQHRHTGKDATVSPITSLHPSAGALALLEP
jgi:hypothetical protein